MADKKATPSASDDPETAERKSKTVDERIPAREATDGVPEVVLPGSAGAYVPQGGVGREGPPGTDVSGRGETALEKERKAQITPTSHG